VCAHSKHGSRFGKAVADESPLIPALQLYVRDVPELPHPAGADLLQILWCPVEEDHAFMDQPVLRWRDSASVTERLDFMPAAHPEAWTGLIPRPCTIDPEVVIDYPYEDAPGELYERFKEAADGWRMWNLLIVLGCKVGGYPSWVQPPEWPTCPACHQQMNHLLTLIGDEGGRNWIPFEEWSTAGYDGGIQEAAATHTEAAEANRHPLGMTFGDNGGFYVFYCATCPDMPLAHWFDSH
jgi:hypothetical protein